MSARRACRRLATDTSGHTAVEFAFVAPVMLSVFFGGFTVSQAVEVARKVTVTTRALADLTTQFAAMSATDMTNVLNASTQIMAPFSPTPLAMRISQITTDATGTKATVAWSVARSMTAYTQGQPYTLPTSMQVPNVSYVYSETSYVYTPITNIAPASVTMTDHIYMLPRLSTSINYTN